jgi:hypothetical protein
MIFKNSIKTLFLRINKKNLGYGKSKYTLSLRDFVIKLTQSKYEFEIDVVLCGFPRSGTHWIRNVISKSLKKYCPTLEDIDYSLAIKQYHLPLLKIHARSMLVAKLKMFFLMPPTKSKKYIYVYRDPRDAIISLYNMYNILKKENLTQDKFLKLYDPIGQYFWEINSWVLNKNKNTLLVKFEDLKFNPKKTFSEILNYIDSNANLNQNSFNELVGQVENNSRVKGVLFGWKDSYSSYKTLIDEINLKLSNEIKLLGYDE